MAKLSNKPNEQSDDVNLEVVLQRIFREMDPAAHREAIWELFHVSEDWNVFDRVSEYGGEQAIADYFKTFLNQMDEPNPFDENESDAPSITPDQRNEIRELYTGPLQCLQRQDWAGAAAAMHDILLMEIYETCDIDEDILELEAATSAGLKKWVPAEILFPLSVIEYLAYSNRLRRMFNRDLLNNHLSLLLTLFFSAEAHIEVLESKNYPHLEPGDDDE